jgi:hypothetical protein
MKDYSLFSISNSSGNFIFLQESMLAFGRDEIYIPAELPSVLNSPLLPLIYTGVLISP